MKQVMEFLKNRNIKFDRDNFFPLGGFDADCGASIERLTLSHHGIVSGLHTLTMGPE